MAERLIVLGPQRGPNDGIGASDPLLSAFGKLDRRLQQ